MEWGGGRRRRPPPHSQGDDALMLKASAHHRLQGKGEAGLPLALLRGLTRLAARPANLVSRINQTPGAAFSSILSKKLRYWRFTAQFGTVAAFLLIIAERRELRRKGSAIMEPRRLVGIWRVTPIAVTLLLAGGCSNALQSDQGKLAIAGHEVALAPQSRQRTINEYASHCDEQTRQRQHELANCTAVQLIDIQMEPKS